MVTAESFEVRRELLVLEEAFRELGPRRDVALHRGAILAVVENPFAGRWVEDIASAMEVLSGLGQRLAARLVDELGGPESVESYGKGAIVGEDGELEHGALWHVPGGHAMRKALGRAHAIVPSAKKVGGVGARLDVPLAHKDASYVRSHFDAMEVGVPGHPRRDEIVFVLAMSNGARVHERLGGLQQADISEWDGLR